jgi:GDP-4-dehydro-6-deoxy-D-mannose reductase
VYGAPARLPVDEDAPLRPQNPYAVSKAACDLLGGQYADAFGLRVVRMRPFNHAGPGQSDDYVVGTLTRQVAEAEVAGREEAVVRTGNPDSARDFTDVRDVVRAYVAATSTESGAFNVASGRTVTVRELIELVRSAAPLPVRHEIDASRVRAHDVPEVRGSAERLREATGWAPEIPLERTVADALDEWRERLSR